MPPSLLTATTDTRPMARGISFFQELPQLPDVESSVDAEPEDDVKAKQEQKERKQKMHEPLVRSVLCC